MVVPASLSPRPPRDPRGTPLMADRRSRPGSGYGFPHLLVGLACLLPALVQGQTRGAGQPVDLVDLISALEARGAQVPAVAVPALRRESFERLTGQGSAERRCVRVSQGRTLRSGDFVLGGETGADHPPRPGRPAKLWWAPLLASGSMELLVAGTHPASGDTLRLVSDRVAYPGFPRVVGENEDWFFPTVLTLEEGLWVLVATSGDNWGCFLLDARSPTG